MVDSEYSKLDISDFSEADRHKFMMGTVIPRPTALVTSLSRDGVLNAAPFSQFVVISVTPPPPGFVAHEAEDGLKDTVRNILESKEYVINTVTEAMANQVQICSENFPPSDSEVAEVGFHTLSSSFVRASRIAESPSISNVVCAGRSNSVTTHLLVGEIITTTLPRRRRLRTSRGSSGDEFAGTDGRPQLQPDRR